MKINKEKNKKSITPFSYDSLKSVSNVQEYLYEKNFPCPKVILHPVKYKNLIITVNEYSTIGIPKDAHNPTIRKEIAYKLSKLIEYTTPFLNTKGIKYIDIYNEKNLYPTPHSDLFNFEINYKNTKWIDEIALKSKQEINQIEKNIILGHCDWSLKHFRFNNNKIVMIYDWDSLFFMDEYHMLGIAASTFTTTWDIPVKITPTPEEAYQFIKEYENFRGHKFSKQELKKISCCATYIMAYTAKCESCIDTDNLNFKNSFRESLKNMNGDNYLNI